MERAVSSDSSKITTQITESRISLQDFVNRMGTEMTVLSSDHLVGTFGQYLTSGRSPLQLTSRSRGQSITWQGTGGIRVRYGEL